MLGDTGDGETHQILGDPFKNDDSGGGDIMDDSPMPFGENQDANVIQDVEMEDGMFLTYMFTFMFAIVLLGNCFS